MDTEKFLRDGVGVSQPNKNENSDDGIFSPQLFVYKRVSNCLIQRKLNIPRSGPVFFFQGVCVCVCVWGGGEVLLLFPMETYSLLIFQAG